MNNSAIDRNQECNIGQTEGSGNIDKPHEPERSMELEQPQINYADVFIDIPYQQGTNTGYADYVTAQNNNIDEVQAQQLDQMRQMEQYISEGDQNQHVNPNSTFGNTADGMMAGNTTSINPYNMVNQTVFSDSVLIDQGQMPVYNITFKNDGRYIRFYEQISANPSLDTSRMEYDYTIPKQIINLIAPGSNPPIETSPLGKDIIDPDLKILLVFLNMFTLCMKESESTGKAVSFTVYKNDKIPAGVYTVHSALDYVLFSPFGSDMRYKMTINIGEMNAFLQYFVLDNYTIVQLIGISRDFFDIIGGKYYSEKVLNLSSALTDITQQQQLFQSFFNADMASLIRDQQDAARMIADNNAANMAMNMATNTTVNMAMDTTKNMEMDVTTKTTAGMQQDSREALSNAHNGTSTSDKTATTRKKRQIDGRQMLKRGRKTKAESAAFAQTKRAQKEKQLNSVIRELNEGTKEGDPITKDTLTSTLTVFKKTLNNINKENSDKVPDGTADTYHYITRNILPIECNRDSFDRNLGVKTFITMLSYYGASIDTLEKLSVFDDTNFTSDINTFGDTTVNMPQITEERPYVLIDFGSFCRLTTGTQPSAIGYRKMSITGLYSPSSMTIDVDVESFVDNSLRLIDITRIRDQYVRVLMKSPDIPLYEIILKTINEDNYKKKRYGPHTIYEKKDRLFYKLLYTTRLGGTNTNVNFNIEESPTFVTGFASYSMKSRSNNITSIMLLVKPSPIVFSYTTKGHRSPKYYFEKAGTVAYIAEEGGRKSVVRRHGQITSMTRIIKGFTRRSMEYQGVVTDNGLNYEYKYINEIIYTDINGVIVTYIIPYIVNENRENPYVYDIIVLFYDNQHKLQRTYYGSDFFIYEESVREFINSEILHSSKTTYVYDVLPAALDPSGDVFPRVVNLDAFSGKMSNEEIAMQYSPLKRAAHVKDMRVPDNRIQTDSATVQTVQRRKTAMDEEAVVQNILEGDSDNNGHSSARPQRNGKDAEITHGIDDDIIQDLGI